MTSVNRVYNFSSGEHRREQCRQIQGQYDANDPCWLMAGSGYSEFEPLETTVGGLESVLMAADSAVTLLLPARR